MRYDPGKITPGGQVPAPGAVVPPAKTAVPPSPPAGQALDPAGAARIPPPATRVPPPPPPSGGRRYTDIDRAARTAAAEALRGYADRHHPHAEGVTIPTDYGTGVEYDAVCSGCGASWVEDEGGCTERVQLLADAAAIERGDEPTGG